MLTLDTQINQKVILEGEIKEIDSREGELNGVPYLSGRIYLEVPQVIGGKEEINDICCSFFASKFKKDSKDLNPAYKNMEKILELPRQSTDREGARIRTTLATLQENMFMTRNGSFVDSWQIKSNFFNLVTGEFSPRAVFETKIVVNSIEDEEDRDEMVTGRLKIKGVVVQWGGTTEILEFFVEDPNLIQHIRSTWPGEQETVKIQGRIRMTTIEKEYKNNNNNGDMIGEEINVGSSTQYVNELIITSTALEPFGEDSSYDPEEIQQGLAARRARINKIKTSSTGGQSKSSKSRW